MLLALQNESQCSLVWELKKMGQRLNGPGCDFKFLLNGCKVWKKLLNNSTKRCAQLLFPANVFDTSQKVMKNGKKGLEITPESHVQN